MTTNSDSYDYIQTISSSGDVDQLVPTKDLRLILAEIDQLKARISTQADLLSIYRERLSEAETEANT